MESNNYESYLTASNANPIQFWDINDDTFNEKDVCSIYSKCFMQAYHCDDDIMLQVDHTAGQTVRANIYDSQDFSGSVLDTYVFDEISAGIYRVSFDFSNVCSNTVRLKIMANDVAQMKSDIIDPQELHECTTLINYTNSKVFAGLDYVIGTPPPEFNIRIPAIFLKRLFPMNTKKLI